MPTTGYDVIGDIHGHADHLEALLKKLGYQRQHKTWRHPERIAVFVGDLIDRGPRQLDTVDIVRHMVDGGHAHIAMGNHEFNAVAWHMRDEQGQPLRSHNAVHTQQHRAFLAEVGERPALHQELVDWFMTIPLWLDLPGLRVIHACWHEGLMRQHAEQLNHGAHLRPELMQEAARRPAPAAGHTLYHAIETWLKGIEAPLPDGMSFLDKDKNPRHEVRVRWWDAQATRYPEAALVDDDTRSRLPALEIPAASRLHYDSDAPVLFGHYWMRGQPALQSPRFACMDFSVARGGVLAAYRWSGEPQLKAEHLVWVGEPV